MNILDKIIYWFGRIFGQRFRNWYHEKTGRSLWGIIGFIQNNTTERYNSWGKGMAEKEFDKWLEQIR